MGNEFIFNSTIKGDLPVRVEAYYMRGSMGTWYDPPIDPEIEIGDVRFMSGHKISWDLSSEDIEHLTEQAFEFIQNDIIAAADYLGEM